MTPEKAQDLALFFAETIEREHATTRKVIAAIPEEKADYRPDPKSMSALDLAWHLAGSEWFFARMALSGEMPESDGSRPAEVRTVADVLKFYDEATATEIAKLKNITAEQAARTVDFRGVFSAPAVIYLNLLAMHASHHRGQLSVYLRPMGAPVPSIYGSSADEDVLKAARA